ncbi:hypothetical protein CB1_000683007 [Camelus ferus]|nr:hypothetical protein CB1_000683007 [Camelus ferus]
MLLRGAVLNFVNFKVSLVSDEPLSVFLSTWGTTRLVPNDAAWSSSLNTCYGNSSDTWQPPRPMAETLVHVPVVPQRGLKAPRSHGSGSKFGPSGVVCPATRGLYDNHVVGKFPEQRTDQPPSSLAQPVLTFSCRSQTAGSRVLGICVEEEGQHLPYGLSDMTVADMHATHVTTGANDCVEHKARPGGESPPPGPFSAEAAPTHRPGSDAEGPSGLTSRWKSSSVPGQVTCLDRAVPEENVPDVASQGPSVSSLSQRHSNIWHMDFKNI